MHEAAEDGGDAITGVLGILVFIGICLLFEKLFGNNDDQN